MNSPLGKKVVPPAPPPPPEWTPHPDKPGIEVNRSGEFRTNIPPPAEPPMIWPF
jgi:hypothetical protein